MEKALLAAKRIFKIVETESEINAIEMDEDKTKIILDKSRVKGKIEFKDVWFRYPTRK
jgi:ABC-type multidrug transport system fused ATPase/permease subunit